MLASDRGHAEAVGLLLDRVMAMAVHEEKDSTRGLKRAAPQTRAVYRQERTT